MREGKTKEIGGWPPVQLLKLSPDAYREFHNKISEIYNVTGEVDAWEVNREHAKLRITFTEWPWSRD